jgi:uncharacterized protein
MGEGTWTPGAPIWADLATSDVEGAKAFYGSLFGWEPDPAPNPEARGYVLLRLGGKDVAGVGPVQMPEQPPAWLPYIGVEDVEATMAAVKEAGGDPFFGPMDVLDTGRMGIFRDPTGAALGVWQPRTMTGFEVADQPGSFAWFDLNTKDVEAAKPFYSAVLGWGSKTSGEGQMQYTEWKLGDRSIGGAVLIGPQAPANVPPHWLVYFAVPETGAAVGKIRDLGGTPLMEPMEFPGGTFAVARDPQNAVFAVLTLSR